MLAGPVVGTSEAVLRGLAWLFVAALIGWDVGRSGHSGVLWGLLVILIPPVGLVGWLYLRRR